MSLLNFDKIYVINLEHRKDRWEKIQEQFAKNDISMTNVIKWKAVNGKDLSNDQLYHYTSKLCYYFCNAGIVGCFLSHLSIWQDVVKNKYNKVLILEDDVQFTYNIKQLNTLIKSTPKDWDINFLGSYGSSIDPNVCTFTTTSNKLVAPNIIDPCWITGAHAYMINYNSAKKLVNILPKVYYHVDFCMTSKNNGLKIYAQYPPIIKQNDTNDSDIQVTGKSLLSYILNDTYILGLENASFLNSPLASIGNFHITVLILLIIFIGIISGLYKLLFLPIIAGILIFTPTKLEYIIVLLLSYFGARHLANYTF